MRSPLGVVNRKIPETTWHMDSMRSTSLVVTIELTPSGAGTERVAAPWQPDPGTVLYLVKLLTSLSHFYRCYAAVMLDMNDPPFLLLTCTWYFAPLSP